MRLRWPPLLFLLLLAVTSTVHARVEDVDDDDEDEARVESDGEQVISVETLRPEDDVLYITPETNPDVFFAEHFDDEEAFEKKWIK